LKTPDIEGRAVTFAWLKKLTAEEVTPELCRQATASAIAYLDSQLPTQRTNAADLYHGRTLRPIFDVTTAAAGSAVSRSDAVAMVDAVFEFADVDEDGLLSKQEFARLDALLDGQKHQVKVRNTVGEVKGTDNSKVLQGDQFSELWHPAEVGWEADCATVGADPATGLTRAQFGKHFFAPGQTRPKGWEANYRYLDMEAQTLRKVHIDKTDISKVYARVQRSQFEKLSQQQRDLAGRRQGAFLSGRDLHRHVVKAKTHNLLCRYVELADVASSVDADGTPSIGLADAFVSWSWDTPWNCVLEILEQHTNTALAAGQPPPHYW
jgi:hypothetical protein